MDLKILSVLILTVEINILVCFLYFTKSQEQSKDLVQMHQFSKKTFCEGIPFERHDTVPENTESLPFLKTFRNPCWWESLYSNRTLLHLRCLPYFYLAGFPKCGTTDLYKRLVIHPLISGKCIKENHWLSRMRFLENNTFLSNYLNYFDTSVSEDISTIKTNGYHTAIFGDCSASTAWDNYRFQSKQRRQNKSISPMTAADVIFKLNPNAKVIFLLRNPTTRLYSEYAYFKMYNLSADDFHNRVVKGIARFQTCLSVRSIEHCAYTFNQTNSVRINVGLYYIYIRDFMRVFPVKQVKIIKLEDFSVNTLFHMSDLFYFLEVGMPGEGILNRVVNMTKTNDNSEKKTKVGKMLRKTFDLLNSFYKPFNKQLAELTGHDFDMNY